MQVKSKSEKQLDNEQATIDRYDDEAYPKGWRFIGWSMNGIRQYKRYECLACEAAQDITPASMRTYQPKCLNCRNNVYKDEAAKATPALALLGPAQEFGHDGNYRQYRCLSCDHTQDLQLGAVRANKFQCQQCKLAPNVNNNEDTHTLDVNNNEDSKPNENAWLED